MSTITPERVSSELTHCWLEMELKRDEGVSTELFTAHVDSQGPLKLVAVPETATTAALEYISRFPVDEEGQQWRGDGI